MTQQHPPRHGPRPTEYARTTDGISFTEHVVGNTSRIDNHWTRSFAVASANRNFGGLHGHMSHTIAVNHVNHRKASPCLLSAHGP